MTIVSWLDRNEFLKSAFLRPVWDARNAGIRFALVFFIFVLAFGVTFAFNYDKTTRWRVAGDTTGYLSFDYANPWRSVRSPGTPFYFDLLVDRNVVLKELRKEKDPYYSTSAQVNSTSLNAALKRISLANVAVMSLGTAALLTALCFHMPFPVAAVLMVVTIYTVNVFIDADRILSEPPAIFCMFLFVALALIYFKTSRFFLLPLLAAVTAVGYLVRPASIFLAAIAAALIALDFWRHRLEAGRIAKNVACAVFLCVGMAAFPFQLYLTSGIVTLGQLNGISKIMFALFLAEPQDVAAMRTEEQRADLAKFFTLKSQAIEEIEERNGLKRIGKRWKDLDLVSRYFTSVNFFGWRTFQGKICGERQKFSSPQERYSYYVDFASQILSRHKLDYARVVKASFFSAFRKNKIYVTSQLIYTVERNLLSPPPRKRTLNLIYPEIVALIIAALWKGIPAFRAPIVTLAAMHFLAVLSAAIGHAILRRYLIVTEWCVVLATALAVVSLIAAFCSRIMPGVNDA